MTGTRSPTAMGNDPISGYATQIADKPGDMLIVPILVPENVAFIEESESITIKIACPTLTFTVEFFTKASSLYIFKLNSATFEQIG